MHKQYQNYTKETELAYILDEIISNQWKGYMYIKPFILPFHHEQ